MLSPINSSYTILTTFIMYFLVLFLLFVVMILLTLSTSDRKMENFDTISEQISIDAMQLWATCLHRDGGIG